MRKLLVSVIPDKKVIMLRRLLFHSLFLFVVLSLSVLLITTIALGVRAESITHFSCADVTEIPQVECEALVALYNSTNGANWLYNGGWLPICPAVGMV